MLNTRCARRIHKTRLFNHAPALVSLAFATFLQTVSGQQAGLSGIVRDISQAAIPGATVTAIQQETNTRHPVVSTIDGRYSIPLLPPGRYTIDVQAPGFQSTREVGVKLDVGQAARLDFALRPGIVEQSVTVNGETTLVRTDSSTVSTVVNRELIENLPLNGRSFQSLIALTPGVVLCSRWITEREEPRYGV